MKSEKGSQKDTEAKPEEEHTTHVFDSGLLGRPLVPRFSSSDLRTRKSPDSAKALRGLAWPCRYMNRTGMWGNYCLTSTRCGAAEMGGIPEGAQCNAHGSKAVQLPQLLTA